MAEKPKIDLKARLGKAQVGSGNPTPAVAPVVPGMGRGYGSAGPPGFSSTTPPAAAGGFGAAPAMQSPGGQVGVPMPPFGGSSAPSTDAFGARVAPSPIARTAGPATFKIELDEETMRAARRGG